MNAVPNPPTGKRAWTDAQRAEQAARLHARKIWTKSTGPKTMGGKQTSSRNSYKHGRFTYEKKILRWYVRLAAMRIRKIKNLINLKNHNRENELRAKYGFPKPPQPDIIAFYPYFKVHPLDQRPKRRKQRDETGGTLKTQAEVERYFDSLSEAAGEV